MSLDVRVTTSAVAAVQQPAFSLRRAASIAAITMLWLTPALHAAERLDSPGHRASFGQAFADGKVLPRWSGGRLISWRIDTLAADAENLTIYDKTGRVMARKKLWFSTAAMLKIWDAVGSPNGESIAVSGIALSESGLFAGYLAIFSAGSEVATVVQTAPFEGQSLAYGPDGSIWVLGYQLGDQRRLKTAPSHSMLRHYRSTGELVGEYLRWPDIQCGLHPAADTRQGFPRVVTSANRVALVLPSCRKVIQLDLQGQTLGTTEWRPLSAAPQKSLEDFVWNAVMTSSGQIYGNLGQKLYQLDPERGIWQAVDTSLAQLQDPTRVYLAGIDGDSLVYRSYLDLLWAKPGL